MKMYISVVILGSVAKEKVVHIQHQQEKVSSI